MSGVNERRTPTQNPARRILVRTRTKWLWMYWRPSRPPLRLSGCIIRFPGPREQKTANRTYPRPRRAGPTASGSVGSLAARPSPIPELLRLIPGGQNGLGEALPTKYFLSILTDFEPGEE